MCLVPVRIVPVGNKYHMPISVWLMDEHPYTAPLAYVNPSSKMRIRKTRNVDTDGKIELPYLHAWKYVSLRHRNYS